MTDKIERREEYKITLGEKVIELTEEEMSTLKDMMREYSNQEYLLWNS